MPNETMEEYLHKIKDMYNLSYWNEFGDMIDFQDLVGPFKTREEAEIYAQNHLNEIELLTYKINLIGDDYGHSMGLSKDWSNQNVEI